jgi:hypothetical protein
MWHFGAGEVTVILACALVAVWTTIVWVVPFRQSLLGGDFIQFYTFGTAARLGDWTIQYDWTAFHALQVSLVPISDPHFYPPTYPPLVPGLYTAFSLLPFPVAYASWVLFSSVMYGGLIAIAARGCVPVSRGHVLMACLLFPPFVAHQTIGQSTIWPLLGFVSGWWALTQSRPFAAGLMLSVVAIKPHLGMALAIVLLAMRLWRIVGGILLGLVLQAAITVVVCGRAAVVAYLATTLRVLRDTKLIEPKDERFTHALRMSLESLIPHGAATVGWLAASTLFGWMAVRVWRRSEDWALRMSALLLATLLISPHVQAYDAILLAPATLWLACWAASTRQPAVMVGVAVLAVAFVIPSARLWGVPLTLPLMAWLLWRCQRPPEAWQPPHGKIAAQGALASVVGVS